MFGPNKKKKIVYLDYAATTYVDPKVFLAMQPYFSEAYGNPSSLYSLGRQAKTAISDSRKSIALMLNCAPAEIIFTAGGTESVNLGIFGVVRNFLKKDAKFPPHIITDKAEHHAVLRSFEALSQEGVQCSYLNVDGEGFVKLEELRSQIRPETILVSVMYANNEVGAVQPIGEIAREIQKINKEREVRGQPKVLVHCDACQAAGALELNVQKLGVDLLSLNASKIYGPKQIGLLYRKAGVELRPLIFGGGQEIGLRAGTENTAGIVGLAKALEIANMLRIKESRRLRSLRNYFISQALKIEGISLNGPAVENDAEKSPRRLPGNVNLSVSGVEGEALMLYLDSYGVCVSTGSACSTAEADPSHVLMAMGKTRQEAAASIRFTLGRKTTRKDLDYVLKVMPELIQVLRRTVQALG